MNSRQLDKARTCCLSILCRYRDGERTATAKAQMIAEVETVVGSLLELNLAPGVTELEVLKPVEESLLAVYGHEAGGRLNNEFVTVFEAVGMDLTARRDRATPSGSPVFAMTSLN